MTLSIPANWADDFFDAIDFGAVGEVYGKLAADPVGGGRASVVFPGVSRRRVEAHIREVRRRGLRFNYLLNATCLGNAELSRRGQRRIRALLDWIGETGADTVTVALPQLASLVRRHYPSLRLAVSTNVMADNLDRVRFWEGLGAQQITLSYTDVNRDFAELRHLAAHARCELQLIVNLICRRHCPVQALHANFHSHASQSGAGPWRGRTLPLDVHCLRCAAHSFTDPTEVIRSHWIRPEDLARYEAAGIARFKLVERGMNTADLSRIVAAYTARRYDGNLMDLIPTMSKYRYLATPGRMHFLRHFLGAGGARPLRLLQLARRMEALRARPDYFTAFGLYVDNRMLDGFLDRFERRDCRQTLCEACGYCAQWARRAVRPLGDPADREAAGRVLAGVVDEAETGGLF